MLDIIRIAVWYSFDELKTEFVWCVIAAKSHERLRLNQRSGLYFVYNNFAVPASVNRSVEPTDTRLTMYVLGSCIRYRYIYPMECGTLRLDAVFIHVCALCMIRLDRLEFFFFSVAYIHAHFFPSSSFIPFVALVLSRLR